MRVDAARLTGFEPLARIKKRSPGRATIFQRPTAPAVTAHIELDFAVSSGNTFGIGGKDQLAHFRIAPNGYGIAVQLDLHSGKMARDATKQRFRLARAPDGPDSVAYTLSLIHI